MARKEVENSLVVRDQITDKDLLTLFNLYDRYFFNGEIGDRLRRYGKSIHFYATQRTNGMASLVGYDSIMNGYYIDISVAFINSSLCNDKKQCLMMMMERQLVLLMMIMWGFYGKPPLSIYGEGGSLFQCALRKFFSRNFKDLEAIEGSIDLESPASPEELLLEKKILPTKGYSYWENSCYIDSLLVTILLNKSRFWRRHIIFSDIDEYGYPKGFENCPRQRMSQLAKLVQEELAQDLASFITPSETPKQCQTRTLMAECLNLKEGGSWTTYNVGDLYSTFATLFPGLGIDIPYRIYRWNDSKMVHVRGWLRYSRDAALTMWDYMDPSKYERGVDTKKIDWDLCRSPVLVFINGGVPRIRNFNSTDTEIVKTAFSSKQIAIKKRAAFGEVIGGSRGSEYRLVGVIMLLGVQEHQEGGVHYVSFFTAPNGEWYYYDDLTSKTVPEALPEYVWHEGNGKMPAMYMYQRLE